MTTQSALEKYTRAVENIKKHEIENSSVFERHADLLGKLMDAENELRDEVAEAGVGISNDSFNVKITPQKQTIADIEEVDKLVSAGILSASMRENIVKTFDRPAKITISRL